jgi:hypothetical protein
MNGKSSWQSPAFEEINMSAEIGAYQRDDGDRGESPSGREDSADADRARADSRAR